MRTHSRVVRLPRPSFRWSLELIYSLATHRVALRYKETLFGFGWIFLQPVALTIIFTYIFHRFAKIPSGTTPYPLFVAVGLVAWSLTSLVATHAAACLTSHHVLLKRVAFPKILLPLSVVASTLADLGVMALLLIGLFLRYQMSLPASAWWILPIFVLHLLFLVGISLLFSLANVFLRDIGQAITFLLQIWFFVSPIFYPAHMVPNEFKGLSYWNPMTGFIEGYRSTLFLGQPPSVEWMAPAVVVTLFVLTAGMFLYHRLEGFVTDVL